MATEANAIDIEGIQSLSQIFADHSVQELVQLNQRINNDIFNKKQELRNLVGSKYRDLLNVADNIITMNELVQVQDSSLTKLAFKNSNYSGKSLSNINQFHDSITNFKKKDLITQNQLKIVVRLLDELAVLNAKILKLVDEFDIWNRDLNEDDETFESGEFIIDVAIFIYMIELLFKSVLQEKALLKLRYQDLQKSVLDKIIYMLTNLVVDGENELVLNLLNSQLIITKQSPIELFQCFLNSRFKKFQNLNLNQFEFQNSLKYLFNTVSYINLFKTKLVTVTTRTIHLNNSTRQNHKNWFNSSYIVKWKDWILDYDQWKDINFPLSVTDLKNLTTDKISVELNQWKLDVSEHYLKQISFNDDELSNQVDKILGILIGFKNFTSLVDLQLSDKTSLIQILLNNWHDQFLKMINLQLQDYRDITEEIMLDNESVSSDTNLFMAREEDLSNVELYLQNISETASNLVGSNKLLLLKIDNFFKNIRILSKTTKDLLELSSSILKPVLSIDDAEDDLFWQSICDKIKEIHSNSLSKINSDVVTIENTFTEKLNELTHKGIENPTLASNLLRCLIALNNKPKVTNFFTHDSINDRSNMYLDIVIKILKPLIQKLAHPFITQFQQDLDQRFKSANAVSEVILWDKISDDRSIPVQPSYDLVVKLYKLSEEILQNGKNRDILEIDEMGELTKEFMDEFVVHLVDQITQLTSETPAVIEPIKEVEEPEPVKEVEEVQPVEEIKTVEPATESKSKKKKNKKKKKKNGVQGVELSPELSPEPEMVPELVPEAELTAEPETALEPEVAEELVPEAKPEVELEPDAILEPELEVEVKSEPVLESQLKSEAEVVTIDKTEIQDIQIDPNLIIQKSLLTYADLIYLIFFLQNGTTFEDINIKLNNDSTVNKLQKILELNNDYDVNDFNRIHKNVFEFFKSSKSLYIF